MRVPSEDGARPASRGGAARVLAGIALAAVLGGCGGGAKELWDTGQLEELQNSPERARVAYEAIVRDHPDAPEAKAAAGRLEALGGAAPR